MTTTNIICTKCNTRPRLKSLDKNNETCVGCDCDGAKYSMDAVPDEYTVDDLPDSWQVADGDKISMTEEQANSLGLTDWIELQAAQDHREELAKKRGRKNAERSDRFETPPMDEVLENNQTADEL